MDSAGWRFREMSILWEGGMNKGLLVGAAFALALSTGSALSADLPVRNSLPPIVPVSWTGFYIGINAGYAWGDANFNVRPGGAWIGDPDAPGIVAASTMNMNLSGGTVGGTLGYNYQFDRFVAGLEIDGGWMGLRDPIVNGPFAGVVSGTYATTFSASSDYIFTARGRLGYLVTPTFLAFATGGLALSDIQQAQTIYFNNPAAPQAPPPPPPPTLPITGVGGGFNAASVSGGQVGWTVGGGCEWLFLPHWSAKLEYLYADFGKQTVTSAYLSPAGSVWTIDHEFRSNVNIVRVGLNYHFNIGP